MNDTVYYWQALNRALDAEMAADESVIVLGEDVGLYGGSYRVTEGLYAKYGEWRLRDTPISEGSFTGLGVGAAMVELRPVVEIMTINFALLALDAIINMAAKIPFILKSSVGHVEVCVCSGVGQGATPRNSELFQGVATQRYATTNVQFGV